MDFQHYGRLYREELVEQILPFWLKYGLDRKYGGMLTCIDRDGTLMDSTKSVWFQGRSLYAFAYAYNHVERRSEWLEACEVILPFLEKCFDPSDGRMYFEVKQDGTPLRKRRYVFSESFAIIGWVEYAKATGKMIYADRALKLFKQVRSWLATPGVLEPKYITANQPALGHSISMIMMNVAAVLSSVVSDPVLEEQAHTSFRLIKDKFYQPSYHCLLEMVTPEGELIDTLNGRVINPGHCIETAWFLMEASRTFAGAEWAKEAQTFALTVLDDAWAWGWDEKYGGIINFKDCKGFPAQDYSQDMKFWWPQTEAVIATLYAYLLTGDEKYKAWHRQAHDWAWSHLRDTEYGEWYGYLHRDGSVAQPAKGNLFKGPFHIPRLLVKSMLLCGEIEK